MDHCRQRIQDDVDDIEDNRILEEDAMSEEADEINDGDLVENENVDDEIEGNNYAFQILLNMICLRRSMISKAIFWFSYFLHAL